ncbi:hypothetical protein DVJ78_14370 [Humibacter sp. BT305]|nr:hypothetical protein DVJ78_14370 [Humibacter sp. BT305]
MTTPHQEVDSTSGPAPRARWKRPAYLILVVAAFAVVVAVWFHTPTVEVESYSADGGYSTATCANAGPSRFDPPTVYPGQEASSDPAMGTFNQQVIKNDIESLRVDLACAQSRDGHTNTLIVTTFAAGAALLFGYAGLWRRRADAVPPTPLS